MSKHRKTGAKITSLIQKVTSIGTKKTVPVLFWEKNDKNKKEEQWFLKIKTMRRLLSRFKLKKTRRHCFC